MSASHGGGCETDCTLGVSCVFDTANRAALRAAGRCLLA